MITGFNTDIDVEGQVFHIQTEDKGLANPTIETLVYTGGQIVCARKSSYAELLGAGPCDEETVQARMESQHRELIREIRDGKMSKEDLQPFGWKVVSNRSFDQVVAGFLEEHVPVEKLCLDVLEPSEVRAGDHATFRVCVREETTERPVGGVHVVVKLAAGDSTSELLAAKTDEIGCVAGELDVPAKPGPRATIVCEANLAGEVVSVKQRVKRRAKASVDRA